MRKKFPWYFFGEKDHEDAWQKGTLTVDANVILDLYRYNKSTREALLAALESFNNRFWISHQTADEFIRNRRTVIVEMKNDFDKAGKSLEKIEKDISAATLTIRSLRVIPRELSETLEQTISDACEAAKMGIEEERKAIPDYENDDEILLRLEKALKDNIGAPPENVADDLKEAKKRTEEKIPPGYMDGAKEGTRYAGDYLMWSQVLLHCKNIEAPMILVTSEQKEDWWEKKSGKTLNPRLEMLQEAYEETGQRLIMYHTDRFLQLYQERTDGKFNEDALEEIREHSRSREPAVSANQEVGSSDNHSNSGSLRILISRPVWNFTGSGRFNPSMRKIPKVEARIIKSPVDAPAVRLKANTGTVFDFNVHVYSDEDGKILPEGEYLVEYDAVCLDDDVG